MPAAVAKGEFDIPKPVVTARRYETVLAADDRDAVDLSIRLIACIPNALGEGIAS